MTSIINSLTDIYDKKGEEFVKQLFNLNVIISEKISGATFGFEYDSDNFRFYKKSSSNPLTKIDQVLMKFYSTPIEFIKNLSKDILKDIPKTYRFMFEYFVDKQPNMIIYDELPKNSLILSYIVENTEKGKIIISDIKELQYWSKQFNVNPPPVIFQGKLSDKAKDSIFQFLRMTKQQALETFKTTSFTKMLISAIDSKLKKTILNKDLDKLIDGVIFTFENGSEKINAKLIDPVFLEILNSNKEKPKSNMLSIVYGDMIEFMELHRSIWNKYEFKKIDFQDRYLEIISKLFVIFYKKNGERYKDFILTIPNFMKKSAFDLNIDLIENVNLLKLFEQIPKSKDIFKIFLALFRKKKHKVEEFLSPAAIKYQNILVNDLLDVISKHNSKNESCIPIFSEVCNIYSDNFDLFEDKKIEDLSINKVEVKRNINSIISFWQNIFSEQKTFIKNEKLKPINIIIGKFQPINNKHLEFIKELKEKNNYKTFIIQINDDQQKKSQPFNIDISEQLLKKIVDSKNINTIKGYIVTPSDKLKRVINKLSEKYRIEILGVSEKYEEYFKKQIEYQVFEGTLYNIDIHKWSSKQIDNLDITSSKIIEAIKNNDYKIFRKLCPEEFWVNFEQLKEEIKKLEN